MTSALTKTEHYVSRGDGRVYYYKVGHGEPLLLLHCIGYRGTCSALHLLRSRPACPMDINPCNDFNPTDIMFEVYQASLDDESATDPTQPAVKGLAGPSGFRE